MAAQQPSKSDRRDTKPIGPITTTEYHTAGEPFRIVVDGVPEARGATVLDRRSWAQQHLDDHRAFLVNEPRGHADMYGGFITPPDDDRAALGVLFFHKDGFSTACGHGTIALATWAVESGLVDPAGQSTVSFSIDVPSGRLPVEVAVGPDGRVEGVRFWNVDSFVTARDLTVETTIGVVTVDVSFGGAFYGSVALDQTDLRPEQEALGVLITVAKEVKRHYVGHPAVSHRDERLSGMYGVIFHRDLPPVDGVDVHQQNVTVFADGEVDRSPCGSGTSARLAVLEDQGRLGVGDVFANRGIAGGRFDGAVTRIESGGDHKMIGTTVTGAAYHYGDATFVLDHRDPIGLGFQLR